jgi:hypothetical protein
VVRGPWHVARGSAATDGNRLRSTSRNVFRGVDARGESSGSWHNVLRGTELLLLFFLSFSTIKNSMCLFFSTKEGAGALTTAIGITLPFPA